MEGDDATTTKTTTTTAGTTTTWQFIAVPIRQKRGRTSLCYPIEAGRGERNGTVRGRGGAMESQQNDTFPQGVYLMRSLYSFAPPRWIVIPGRPAVTRVSAALDMRTFSPSSPCPVESVTRWFESEGSVLKRWQFSKQEGLGEAPHQSKTYMHCALVLEPCNK